VESYTWPEPASVNQVSNDVKSIERRRTPKEVLHKRRFDRI
jgi:hypothetical protein